MLDINNVLPADFNGVFHFTNWTDTSFTAKWGNIEYTFPAQKTTPLIVRDHTPEQVQNIRKKFAKELAEREFYKSEKLKKLENQTPIGSVGSFKMAAVYTEDDLKPFIQKCLDPLPLAQAAINIVPKKETPLRRDNKGKAVTRVLEDGESLTSQNSGTLE